MKLLPGQFIPGHDHPFIAVLLNMLLIMLLAISRVGLAAECSAIFSDAVNPNLSASGSTLELGGVAWDNDPWPASGTTLSGGDYFFSGANLGNDYTLRIADGAQVRIFVNGSVAFGNGSRLNVNGDPDQFLLVSRGSTSFGNNSDATGLIYASGTIGSGNGFDLVGALAAGGGIDLGNNVDTEYDGSGIGSGLLAGLCESSGATDPVVLSANGTSQGPVQVMVDEDVLLHVQATGCPTSPFLDTYWRGTWLKDGNVLAQISISSPCGSPPVSRSEVFDTEGQYEIEFIAEYRQCFFFFCGGWTEHGSDSIQIEVGDPNSDLTCFNDDFASGPLSADWVTAVASGTFTPQVVNGRLRMTENASNQSTAATLQREIPGEGNLIVLEFDYYAHGGTGADGLAVVLSDAAITPQPGSFGGSLGYAQQDNGDAGFAGGWIGIGLDEFGNFSNPTEGRVGGVGFRPDAIAIRGSVATSYRYLAGTSVSPGIDSTGQYSPHRYRITVDSRNPGEALVSVERDISGSGNNFQELIAPFNALNEPGQAPVPENFLLSLTGSTGGSHNIHELDNIQLCALELNPVGEQIHHFEIIHDGVALTCQPEQVMIRACRNESCDELDGLFTDPVSATLSPSGWVGGDTVSFSGGTTTARFQRTTPTTAIDTVTLGMIGSEPSTRPQSVTLCQVDGNAPSADQCELQFVESGLMFDVPALTANRPSGPVEVRAVRSGVEGEACVPAFENVTRQVDFWSTYKDPNTGSLAVAVNGAALGQTQAAATGIDLYFGPGGVAEINVVYPDAGLMQLDAVYTGSAATEDEGLVMPGRDQFVSVPAGLCVTSEGECPAGDASCAVFAEAGEPFNLSITPVAWESDSDSNFCAGNAPTPNFRITDIALSAEVAAPAGGANGVVTPVDYDQDSVTETVAVQQSEVGVFRFVATPTVSYFGQTVSGGKSIPVGRFYPADFQVGIDHGVFDAACVGSSPSTSFTYTGQNFGWLASTQPTLTITAVSRDADTTTNYTHPDFLKLSPTDVNYITPAQDDEAIGQDSIALTVETVMSTGALTVADDGVLMYRFAPDDSFNYIKTGTSRIEPFEPKLTVIVDSIEDSDGVTASAAPYDVQPDAPFKIRYGRIAMENVYGPETAPLYMPFRAEYWTNNRFVLNDADDCTTYNTADISNDSAPVSAVTAANGTLAAGLPASPLELTPMDIGTDTLTWNFPSWLQDYWGEDSALQPPSAQATFGVYRGHDRIIYWREVP